MSTDKKDAQPELVPVFHIRPVSRSTAELYREKKAGEDSGVDIRFPKSLTIPAGKTVEIDFDIEVSCSIANAWTGFELLPRSSIGKTPLLQSGIRGYDGDPKAVAVTVMNVERTDFKVERGTALFQVVENYLRPAAVILTDTFPKWGDNVARKQNDDEKTELITCGGDIDRFTIKAPKEIEFAPGVTTTVPLGVRACWKNGKGEPIAFWMNNVILGPLERESLFLKNLTGLIDQGYRGELIMKIHNNHNKKIVVEKGKDVAMLWSPIVPTGGNTVKFTKVDENYPDFKEGATARGAGAFGSTGV